MWLFLELSVSKFLLVSLLANSWGYTKPQRPNFSHKHWGRVKLKGFFGDSCGCQEFAVMVFLLSLCLMLLLLFASRPRLCCIRWAALITKSRKLSRIISTSTVEAFGIHSCRARTEYFQWRETVEKGTGAFHSSHLRAPDSRVSRWKSRLHRGKMDFFFRFEAIANRPQG